MPSDASEAGRLLLTVAVGYVGAWAALRLRLPAGALLGPMLLVGTLHVFGAPLVKLDAGYRLFAQVLVGATVASTLTPSVLRFLPRLFGPAAVGVAGLIMLSVLGGGVLHLATGLNPATALFAGAPAGAAEMSLASADLGGDVELVAALQIFRQLSVLVVLPPLLRWLLRDRKSE
jgi:membrane AbrB-like protein